MANVSVKDTIPVKMSSEASFAIEYNFGGRVGTYYIASTIAN